MKKKYKSSWNKDINLPLGILLIGFLVSGLSRFNPDQIGLHEVIIRYLLLAPMLPLIVYVAFKLTYLKIEKDRIITVYLLLERYSTSVKKVTYLGIGKMFGYVPVIELRSETGKVLVQISVALFKKATLKEFISDLKNIKPDIELDFSVKDFLESDKKNKK